MKKILMSFCAMLFLTTNFNVVRAGNFDGLEKYDCVFLYSKINEDKYFKNLEWITFNHYNFEKYPLGLNEVTTNEIMVKYVRCLDKIYQAQALKDYYLFTLKYYGYRSEYTNNYSEQEALPYWKRYLYVFYKIHEKTGQRHFIEDYGSPLRATAALNKAYKPVIPKGMDPYDYWKPIITQDKELMKDKDINNMVFPPRQR